MTRECERVEGRLRDVFGEVLGSMGESELDAARMVVRWYEHIDDKTSEEEHEVVGAIWDAVRDEFGDEVAENVGGRCRKRELVDTRAMMYRLAYEMLPVPMYKVADVLGINREHSTVLNAMRESEGLLRYDPKFRSGYRRLAFRVTEILQEKHLQEST
jgi:chromosomal replication initiation ATPase DnaA